MAWATLLATGVQAIGAISQGNTQAAGYQAAAQANDYNAQILQENAARTARDYNIREDNLRRQQAQFLGRQRAGLAQSGTGGAESGTGLDVQQEDTVNANLDALTMRYEGQTKRNAYLDQANLETYQGQGNRINEDTAKTAGYMGAMGNVLGGLGRYTSTPALAGT